MGLPMDKPIGTFTKTDDGSYAAQNFGTSGQLQVKTGSTSYTRESYLRFDLSSLGAVGVALDERADEPQRQALVSVLHGGETEEAKTHWWVFHAMSSTILPTVYKPIDFEIHPAANAS